MGLFNSLQTIDQANKQVKELEFEFDKLYIQLENDENLLLIRRQWNIVQEKTNLLRITISKSRGAAIASYQFKGRKATTSELFSFLNSTLKELDEQLRQAGA